MRAQRITPTAYRAFQDAYEFFNRTLFARSLPDLLITFQRRSRTRGYFSPDRFAGRVNDATTHELAMNPDTFTRRSDKEILSTLAHEMVHVWQQAHGAPLRRSYHNREWAFKMKEIGLQPTDTGAPGGKETGQHVTHYIVPDGKFAEAFAQLEASGFHLDWQSRLLDKAGSAKKAASKTKFTCSECGQNAWAKPDAALICGHCCPEEDLPLMTPPSWSRLNAYHAASSSRSAERSKLLQGSRRAHRRSLRRPRFLAVPRDLSVAVRSIQGSSRQRSQRRRMAKRGQGTNSQCLFERHPAGA